MGTGSSRLAASYVEASRYWNNIVGSMSVINRTFQEWWTAFCPLSATKYIIVLNPCLHMGKFDLGSQNFIKPFCTPEYEYRTAYFFWEVRIGWGRLGYIRLDFHTDHMYIFWHFDMVMTNVYKHWRVCFIMPPTCFSHTFGHPQGDYEGYITKIFWTNAQM